MKLLPYQSATDGLVAVIDGNDYYRTRKTLPGVQPHGPTDVNIFLGMGAFAERLAATVSELLTSVEFFDLLRGKKGQQQPIYQELRRHNIRLQLTSRYPSPDGKPKPYELNRDNTVRRMYNVVDSTWSSILYVGGALMDPAIRDALKDISYQRPVHLLCLSRVCQFEDHSLKTFASVNDLVELNIAPKTFYEDLPPGEHRHLGSKAVEVGLM